MYERINDYIFIKNTGSFNIAEILECGQCFRFEKINDGEYRIIARERILTIKQNEDGICFYGTSEDEFKALWLDYFDLLTDYGSIKRKLAENDEVMREAVGYADGIRILNQEPWECLISFIISQNNRIPQIKQVIKNISERYGSRISGDTYAFPTPRQLVGVPEAGFMECRAGFRAKYIKDAAVRVYGGEIDFDRYERMETADVRKSLLRISGVGPKVSDCVMLFSLKRHEVFPTDVWIGRIMRHYYFGGGNAGIDTIHELARQKYGDLAGYAQQYLFHYARNNSSRIN